MSHTPGPWRVNGGASPVFMFDIVGPKGEDIAYANQSDGADEPTVYPAEANARLIAAAPDLLIACKETLFGLQHARQLMDLIGDAMRLQAAIKKAEGT